MKDRIDSRQLSRQLTRGRAASATADLSPQLFETLRDIDASIEELLAALRRESRAELPPETRLAGVKKLFLRMLQVYTRRQDAFNARVLETLRVLQRRQRLLESRLHEQNQVLLDSLLDESSDHEAD
ncbi:MAG TPA: hypothetical protein VLV83_23280 [Acidobacteriota bacterium]|nr:hypothetical protein [Acidobacteriota bacterium]